MPRDLHLTPDHVARAFRPVPEPEVPIEGWHRLTEAEIEAEAQALLSRRPEGPLWVFAYGSLLWKPAFEPAARLVAVAPGWHRQFCIEIKGFRGTPEAPGLMMALMPGGSCTGVALMAAEPQEQAAAVGLVTREMPYRELLGSDRWIRLRTPEGPLTALVFYANARSERWRPNLPLPVVAATMARACGYAGSCAEYLRNTITSLEEHGVSDRNLWKLQRMVAEEIDRLEARPGLDPTS